MKDFLKSFFSKLKDFFKDLFNNKKVFYPVVAGCVLVLALIIFLIVRGAAAKKNNPVNETPEPTAAIVTPEITQPLTPTPVPTPVPTSAPTPVLTQAP